MEALAACERPGALCDSALATLVRDLNGVITSGRPLYTRSRFVDISLSVDPEMMSKGSLEGRSLEVLNRLLLEEAFPEAIRKVWDTMAGVYALIHTEPRTALCLSGGGIRSATF